MAETKEKKTRIYKLATEYNLSADSLVEFLNSKGFKVKNHMSLLEDDMIEAIHVHYKKEIEKAQHHYKKLAEFHQKRAERAIKDAKEEGKEVEVKEALPAAESVEPESIIKATEKAVEEAAHIESEKQVQQPVGEKAAESVESVPELKDDKEKDVYARNGTLHFDQGQDSLMLNLRDGQVSRWSKDEVRQQSVEFKTYRLPLRLFDLPLKESKSEKEMTLIELNQALQGAGAGSERYNRLMVELNQRFAMPFGAFLLCFLAVPLGMSPQQHGRIWGLIMGLGVFLIYYVAFTASWRLAVRGQLNPALAPWLPNLIFTGLAAYFWRRTTWELPLVPFSLPLARWLSSWKKFRQI